MAAAERAVIKKVSFKDPENLAENGLGKPADVVVETASKSSAVIACKSKTLRNPGMASYSCPKRCNRVLVRKTANRRTGASKKETVSAEGVSNTRQNVYARPELNTGLQLAQRIQALELETFDAEEAVAARLEGCELTRQKIAEASARPVTIHRSRVIFGDVVPLEFDEDALLQAAAREREARVKAVLPAPRPRDPQPKLEDYLTNDLQLEFAHFPSPGVDTDRFQRTVTAPSSSAYTLYRHRRVWNSLPWPSS